MLEFRKEIFADERDDNLIEVGKPTQRQDILGHVTGRSRYLRRPRLRGPAAPQGAAQPAPPCPHPPHRHRGRRAGAGRQARDPAADVPVNLNTLLSLLELRQGRRAARSPTTRSRYMGEPIVAVVAESEPRRTRRSRSVRVDYEPLPAVLDVEDALKPGAPVVNETYPKNTFEYHGALRPPEAPLRRRRARLRRGRPRARGALPDVADRARADRDQRLHRRARDQRPLRLPHLDPGAVLLGRHRGEDPEHAVQPPALHRRHGRRRLRRQGRHADRAARDPRRHAHRAARSATCSTAWRRCSSAPPRGAERWYHQGRRDERRPDRRAPVHRLLRQRRLHPALELRRDQERRPPARARTRSRTSRADVYCVFTNRTPATRDARLRRHRRRLRDRVPHGQARPPDRHGPDRVPDPQRLPRRRHEGASPRGQELRADRVLPGRGREGATGRSARSSGACPRARAAAASARGSRRRRASGTGAPDPGAAALSVLRAAAPSAAARAGATEPRRASAAAARAASPAASRRSSAPGGADHGPPSRTRRRRRSTTRSA